MSPFGNLIFKFICYLGFGICDFIFCVFAVKNNFGNSSYENGDNILINCDQNHNLFVNNICMFI